MIKMNKHTIFIADLHLNAEDTNKTAAFTRFLLDTSKIADAIYILGDFFDVWVGDDDNANFITEIKKSLRQHTANSKKIYLMRGNRDFLIGKKFIQETGVTLIDDPIKINLYGTPTLLTHGDILCTNDLMHLKFRKFVSSPKHKFFFLMLPLKLRKLIAQQLRNKSSKAKQRKSGTTKGVTESAIINLAKQYHATQIIYGHTHKQNNYNIDQDNTTINCRALGSWEKETCQYLIYNSNHEYYFKVYLNKHQNFHI